MKNHKLLSRVKCLNIVGGRKPDDIIEKDFNGDGIIDVIKIWHTKKGVKMKIIFGKK